MRQNRLAVPVLLALPVWVALVVPAGPALAGRGMSFLGEGAPEIKAQNPYAVTGMKSQVAAMCGRGVEPTTSPVARWRIPAPFFFISAGAYFMLPPGQHSHVV